MLRQYDDLQEEGTASSHPVFVLSTAIFRDATRAQILLGVRRLTPTTERHPGVLSTPTMRIPAQVFALMRGDAVAQPTESGMVHIRSGRQFAVGDSTFYLDVGAFAIETILARKLGLAETLVLKKFKATARAELIALENVRDPLGTTQEEWTQMLSYAVVVTEGSELIPKESVAYSRLIWAPSDLVGGALYGKDALLLDDTLDPFEVCIDGLCVRSAVALLEGGGEGGI